MKEQLEKIKEEALRQIESSEALERLNDIRVSYLGKKGELTNLLKSMKDVAPEDRPKVGKSGKMPRFRLSTAGYNFHSLPPADNLPLTGFRPHWSSCMPDPERC